MHGQVYNPIGFDEQGNLIYDNGYTVHGEDNLGQARATSGTNASNMMLAKYQNDWNVEQWNRENEYNTPEAQRQRMLDAGLNPLYYAGQITNGNATNPVQSADMKNEAPQLNTSRSIQQAQVMATAAGQLLDQKKLLIENKKADAEIRQLDASAANLEKQSSRYGYQNRLDEANIARIAELMKVDRSTAAKNYSELQVNNSLIDQNYANVRKMDQETKLAYEKTVTEQMTRSLSIEKMRTSIALDNARITNENETLHKIQAEVKKINSDALLNGVHLDISNLEHIEKSIELMWKDAGLEAEYLKNRSQIHSNLWGMLSPISSLSSSLPGAADVESFDNFVLERGSHSNPRYQYGTLNSPSYVRSLNEQ